MTPLLVALGAMVGAPTRYLADVVIASRVRSHLPWGTLTVNVVGSFVLGLVAALVAGGTWATWTQSLLGAGFCGALTTFSTFSYDTVRLAEDGRRQAAVANVVVSIVASFLAVAAGWWLGS
ncbi:fluoride efflux transporter CrcB [Nocardioides sp.]|uniref:fluoride efflux transporter CrcB n=1 Tax=Nocardioides sp. TaxID=35761 RepID=UPI00262260F0|nr:fluoride efflux transporter CrcB [Nocardioides sp.]